MTWVLQRRSIRSEKGKRPVPPATRIILPEGVVSSSSPLPLARLNLTLMFKKLAALMAEVSFPFGYTLNIKGKYSLNDSTFS